MKFWKRMLLVCLCLFLLYEVKSALGINLSERYHAIDLVRIPAKFVVRGVEKVARPFYLPDGMLL